MSNKTSLLQDIKKNLAQHAKEGTSLETMSNNLAPYGLPEYGGYSDAEIKEALAWYHKAATREGKRISKCSKETQDWMDQNGY